MKDKDIKKIFLNIISLDWVKERKILAVSLLLIVVVVIPAIAISTSESNYDKCIKKVEKAREACDKQAEDSPLAGARSLCYIQEMDRKRNTCEDGNKDFW